MGDIADELISQGLDNYWDAFDDDLGYDESGYSYFELPKTCHYCKTKNLYWGQYNDRWALFTVGGKLHTCKEDANANEWSELCQKLTQLTRRSF